MTYSQQLWSNDSGGKINADRLNHIEQGIAAAHDLAALGGSGTSSVSSLNPPHRSDPIFERNIGANVLAGINDYTPFTALETLVQRDFGWFHQFADLSSAAASTYTALSAAANDGKGIMLSLRLYKTTGTTYSALVAGSYDAKLLEWFSYLSGLKADVVIRLNWEGNGNIDPTNPAYVGADRFTVANASEWIAAWRYVVNLARSNGYSRFKWFWCMNSADVGTVTMEQLWPGSDVNGRPYADIVGYDSYNGLDGSWKSAEDTLKGTASGQGNAYDRVCALHRTAEVWIGETSSVDVGDPADTGNLALNRSKGQWWRDLFAYTGLARLTTVLVYSKNRTRDFRVDSTAASLAGFRDGIAGRKPATPGFSFPTGSVLLPSGPIGVSASGALGNGTLRAVPFYLPTTQTIGALGAEVTVAGEVGSKVRLGLYSDNGAGMPGRLIVDAGQIAGDAVAAAAEVSFTAVTLDAGWYWAAVAVQSAATTQPTLRTIGNWAPPGFLFTTGTGAPSAAASAVGYSMAGVTGALPTAFSTSVGPSGVAARVYLRTA